MLIHTDRRTYSLELISITEGQYMPFVGFVYPEVPARVKALDAESWSTLLSLYQQADILKNAEAAQEAAREASLGARGVKPEAVFAQYTIKVIKGGGAIAWKPTSVYDARGHTYIVMPERMQVTESPAFFIKANGREKLTNYRVEGNLFIVDRLFDIGILQVGGDRVAIYRDTKVASPQE
jgi:type IV secretory pathway VirB9-like protein